MFKWAKRDHLYVDFKWPASRSRTQGYILSTVPAVSMENTKSSEVNTRGDVRVRTITLQPLAEGLGHVSPLETGETYRVLRQSNLDSTPRSVKLAVFTFEFIYLFIKG